MTTQNRIMDKRIRQLEGHNVGSPVLVLLCDKGESSDSRVRRWETENGPIGNRCPIVVSFINAKIEQDL